MRDCIPSTLTPYSGIRISKSGSIKCNWNPINGPTQQIHSIFCSKLAHACNLDSTSVSRGSLNPNGIKTRKLKSMNGVNVSPNERVLGSEYYDFYGELGFKEKREERFELGKTQNDAELENSMIENEIDSNNGIKEDGETGNAMASPSSNFAELKGGLEGKKGGIKSKGVLKDEDLVRIDGTDRVGSKGEQFMKLNGGPGLRNGRRVMRRSNMIAKQVISIQSALSLGFVSQLWVDTSSL